MATHWADIQKNVFTRWANEHLKDRGYHIEDVGKDLNDGLLLINLLEIISGKSFGRYNRHPVVPFQKIENCQMVIQFVEKEGIKLVNISGDDIAYNRLKLILGLLWTLVLRYQINKKKNNKDTTAKNELLEWVRSKIPEYDIQNFQKDWNDGRAICGLVNAVEPDSCPGHRDLDPKNKAENAKKGIDIAYDQLGIPQIVLPDEMTNPRVDEHAMMAYISYFRDLDEKNRQERREAADRAHADAAKCRAYGPGLTEGIIGEDASFTIVNPTGRGKIEVRVEGPDNDAKVEVKENGDGTYSVSYHPTVPGTYRVHVTLDGVHIPGSVFEVTVLESLNLGGEGKIRVFYSTTSASSETTRPLQELLESKSVHLRPDFEPWIAVDILEPKDRDLVFKKAGVKKLPIVYIDDVYIGSMEKIFELEKSGQLDNLLKSNKFKFDAAAAAAGPSQVTVAAPAPVAAAPVQKCKCGAVRKPPTAKFCSCGKKFK